MTVRTGPFRRPVNRHYPTELLQRADPIDPHRIIDRCLIERRAPEGFQRMAGEHEHRIREKRFRLDHHSNSHKINARTQH